MFPSFEKAHGHSPVIFYLRTLLYMCLALLLRVLALAPLACLFLFPEGSLFRWGAFLCPAFYFLLLLPLRFSFAMAVTQKEPHRFFSFDTALSTARYGEKLGESFFHLLNVLKWALPLAAMLGCVYYYYHSIDSLTLLSTVVSLGEWAIGLYAVVAGILGIPGTADLVGGLVEGFYVIIGALGIGVLILLIGIMRNSAFRYVWALSVQQNRNPRTEMKYRVRRCRFLQLMFALINLVLLLPFFYFTARSIVPVMGSLSFDGLLFASGSFVSPEQIASSIGPMLFAFFCVYFPLLPLRRILTAVFATRPMGASGKGKSPASPERTGPIYPNIPIPSAKNEEIREPIPVPASEPRNDIDPSAFTVGQ